MLAFGYTGQAYFGSKTTDQYLASAVSALDLRGDSISGQRFDASGVDYSEVVRRVAVALRAADVANTVTIAGYYNAKNAAHQTLSIFMLPLAAKSKLQHLKVLPQALLYTQSRVMGWVDREVTPG